MKRCKCRLLCLLIITSLMLNLSLASVFAADALTPISGALLNDQLLFTLDGAAVVPVGDDGTPVLPISYNGTTYLPIRAVGYMLGLGIDYDGPTHTVIITSTTDKPAPVAGTYTKSMTLIPINNALLNAQLSFTLDGKKVIPVGDDGTPVLPISYNGTTYLPVRAVGYLLGLGIDYATKTKTVLITRSSDPENAVQPATGSHWKLQGVEFSDATRQKTMTTIGTSELLTDNWGFEGGKNDLTLYHTRTDHKNTTVAATRYSMQWTDPPEIIYDGDLITITYEMTEIGSLLWEPEKQYIGFNQGFYGNALVTKDGTKLINKDGVYVLTTEKPIVKGAAAGAELRMFVYHGEQFKTDYVYTWVE